LINNLLLHDRSSGTASGKTTDREEGLKTAVFQIQKSRPIFLERKTNFSRIIERFTKIVMNKSVEAPTEHFMNSIRKAEFGLGEGILNHRPPGPEQASETLSYWLVWLCSASNKSVWAGIRQ
jgi:hypothetical protein